MNLRTVDIVGGGLAGLALGIGLRARGVPVRLREASSYPRHRVCGEFITALDTKTQTDLGLEKVFAEALQASSVSWQEPGRRRMRHQLPSPALCLSRHRLDLVMSEQFAASGGELETNCRAPSEHLVGRIFACGRRPEKTSRWIGLKQHFRQLPLNDDLELHLGKNAYTGLTRVENGIVNVCGLFPRPASGEDANLCSRLHAVGLSALAERISAAVPVEGSACATAGLDYDQHNPHNDSIGDHAGLIPPFTGHGMTIALQSAAIAAPLLEAWSQGRADWTQTLMAMRKRLRRRFARRLAWGRVLHPWILHPRRRTAIHAMHRVGLLPFRTLYHLCH